MPDLSADRPLLLPEKQFTDEDVTLVAKAIGADYWIPSDRSAAARDILAALAAAGRLLPPDAEHREEWGIRWFGHEVEPCDAVTARRRVGRHPRDAVVVRKITFEGPWVEVDGSPTDV